MKNSTKNRSNPIIDELKAASGSGALKFAGFIGQGAGGRIELYFDLSLGGCIEIAESDVVYVIDGAKPTEPSLVFVRKDARVTARVEMSAEASAGLGYAGCGCDSGGEDEPGIMMARRRPSSDKNASICMSKQLGCNANCILKHDDPMMQSACIDSCAAAYRLCRSFPSGGLVMF